MTHDVLVPDGEDQLRALSVVRGPHQVVTVVLQEQSENRMDHLQKV